MARIVLASVSVDDYQAMRGYFEQIVRDVHESHTEGPSEQREAVGAIVARFLTAVDRLLGARRGETGTQIRTAIEEGGTHCDLEVEADTTIDLTRTLLDLLRALEELRLSGGAAIPPAPAGIRAFILACQAAARDDLPSKPAPPRHSSARPARSRLRA